MEIRLLLETLLKHNLTIEEYFLLVLLYYRQAIDAKEVNDWMKEYAEKLGHPRDDGKRTLASNRTVTALMSNGWITKPDDKAGYVLSKKVDELFIEPFFAGEQLYNTYPSYGIINGVKIPLQVSDRIAVYYKYWRVIRGSTSEHKEILEDIQFGADNDLLSMNIGKFVDSMYWLSLRQMRRKNKIITTNISSFYDKDF